ncbi:MAG: hypothetical protein Tsb0019_04600 [Roseibium sp.]
MLVQHCLKGLVERQPGFTDPEVAAVLTSQGLSTSWLRNSSNQMTDLPADSHNALSSAALDRHVNNFGQAAQTTPYYSLSAGCVELDISTRQTTTFPALQTALDFCTDGGRRDGYVFKLWVLVSPKPAPELPGFAEEVRELNLFRQFATFHFEGEVAAKLFIPARQIEYVEKYDMNLNRLWRAPNPNYVPPERVSNVLDLI